MKAHRKSVAAAAASVLAFSSLALGLEFEAPPERVLNTELDDRSLYDLALAGGATWIAVWNTTDTLGGTIGSDKDLVMVRASDGAPAWSSPVPLNPDAASDSSSQADVRPAIATDGSGNWIVAWISLSGSTEQLKTLRSTDDGLTWDSSRVVATGVSASSVRIETDRRGLWIVTWDSNESVTTPTGPSGTDWDIFMARSTDVGGSWSAPELVNSDAVGDEHLDIFPAIATDRQGTWMIAWSAYLYSGYTPQYSAVRVATSTNGGQTWETPVTPFDPPTPPVEYQGPESFRPALATDGCGNWILFSGSNRSEDDHVGGSSGLLGMRSVDAGQSWLGYWRIYPVPPPYSPDSWLGGDPSLATDRLGAWRLVWRGDGISWSGTQGSGGGQWGDPNSLGPPNTYDGPVIATNEQGRWRVL